MFLVRKYLILAVLMWVSPAFSHESQEELAAIQAQEEQAQQANARAAQRRKVAMFHAQPQAYIQSVKGWQVRLLVFPAHTISGVSKMHVFVTDKQGKAPHLTQVSIIMMEYAKKVIMQAKNNFFQASLHFPSQQRTTLMVKIKDEHLKSYFVQFQH